MKRRLGSGRISPSAVFEPATPWSEVGSANRSATRTLRIVERNCVQKMFFFFFFFFYFPPFCGDRGLGRGVDGLLKCIWVTCAWHMSRDITKQTKWVYAQRRLRSAWEFAQSDKFSLCAQWVAKDPRFLHADRKDSAEADLRLRWAHSHFLGFVMRRLRCVILVGSCRKIQITCSKIERRNDGLVVICPVFWRPGYGY